MDTAQVVVILHVMISLVAIVAGFVAMSQMLRQRATKQVSWMFLSMTLLTSLTGFAIPAKQLTPAHILGFLSVAILAAAIYALYSKRLIGRWYHVYVVTAVLAQYFNVFVLIIQSFQKVPPLRALDAQYAPLPMAFVQLAVVTGFIVFTVRALMLARGKTMVSDAA